MEQRIANLEGGLAALLLSSGQAAGAVVAFSVAGGAEAGMRFVDAFELHSHVANIGDVRPLVVHPALTGSHTTVTIFAQAAPCFVNLA